MGGEVRVEGLNSKKLLIKNNAICNNRDFLQIFKNHKYHPNFLDSKTTEHLRAEVSIYYEKIEKINEYCETNN
jgi:hypothetical protein